MRQPRRIGVTTTPSWLTGKSILNNLTSKPGSLDYGNLAPKSES